MRITKEFRIQDVKTTRISNAPFQIMLDGNPFRREEKSSLKLDADTCARYHIPISLDLLGKTLICSFESHELPLKDNGCFKGLINMELLKNDDLMIHSLSKNETVSPHLEIIPPLKHYEISRTLKLLSFDGGAGNPRPCPFYQIVLELSDEEYEACKALPATSVIRVNFRLA